MFLVARPEQKAQATAKQLLEKGLSAHAFPVLNIRFNKSINLGQTLSQFCPPTVDLNTLIVTSTYAAKWLTQQVLTTDIKLLKLINVVSIGEATAEIINTSDFAKIIKQHDVAEPQNSEGALCTRLLKEVENHYICIVKGEGGRQLLKQTLTKRGAQINELNVYKRTRNLAVFDNYTFEQDQIKCIIATSIEIVDALFLDIFSDRPAWLYSLSWIVPSERIKTYLQKHCNMANPANKVEVYVSDSAGADALANCAQRLVISGALNV